MRSIYLWQEGEQARELRVCRPCTCGCDARGGLHGVGYLTGSDPAGNGFTSGFVTRRRTRGSQRSSLVELYRYWLLIAPQVALSTGVDAGQHAS
jgi:hypothetical protein